MSKMLKWSIDKRALGNDFLQRSVEGSRNRGLGAYSEAESWKALIAGFGTGEENKQVSFCYPATQVHYYSIELKAFPATNCN